MLADDSEDNTREGRVFSVLSDRHKSLISLLSLSPALCGKRVARLVSVSEQSTGVWRSARGAGGAQELRCSCSPTLAAEPHASGAAAAGAASRARDPPLRVRYSAASAATSAARSTSITRSTAQSSPVQSSSDSLLSAVTSI